jgi:hypothetical protein
VIVVRLIEAVKRLRQNAGKTIDTTNLNEEGKLNLSRIEDWIANLQTSTENFEGLAERGRQTVKQIYNREVKGNRGAGLPQ